VKRELDPLKRRVADREQEAAEMESRDAAPVKANDNILADGKATPEDTHHDHRPQAPSGGGNSSAAVLETAVTALVCRCRAIGGESILSIHIVPTSLGSFNLPAAQSKD
jgi:hypothetical protein